MPNLTPYEVHPKVGQSGRDTRALVTSLIFHTLLILVVVLWPASRTSETKEPISDPGQVVALDPEIPFQEKASPAPPPPSQLPDDPVPLGPDSKRPDDPPVNPPEVPQTEQAPVDDSPMEESPAEEQPEASAEMARVPTPKDLYNEGVKFGSPTSPFSALATGKDGPPPKGNSPVSTVGSMGRTGVSNSDKRSWRKSFPAVEAAGQCVEIPDLGVNADGTPVLASVIGVVRDQNGRPLPGAHLQIVGAPFATFADGAGIYRLEFDPKLLEKCRSQLVRVSAPGYRDQNLNLAVGRRVESDDVIMRRR